MCFRRFYYLVWFFCFSSLLTLLSSPLKAQNTKAKNTKVKVLVIDQYSDGFPGTKTKGKRVLSPQKVYVYKNMLVIENQNPPKMYRIVRLDKQMIWEVDPIKKIYKPTPFSEFVEMAKKREANRQKLRERILKSPLPEKDKDKRLKEMGLTRSGKDEIVLSRGAETLMIGQYNCRGWQIKKNGNLILDGWTAEKLKFPSVLLKFYRAMGIFTDKEVTAISKIKGFPIRLQVLIDLGLKGVYAVRTNVSKVRAEEIDPSLFELPRGYKKYTKPKPKKICPQCGKSVDTFRYRVVWKRRVYYCCSKKHQIRWMIRCVRRKK